MMYRLPAGYPVGSLSMEDKTMERIEMLRITGEDCKVQILATDSLSVKTLWEGTLQDIPMEYDLLPILSERRILGEDKLLLIVPLEAVRRIRESTEMLRKQIRKAMILQARGPDFILSVDTSLKGVFGDEE